MRALWRYFLIATLLLAGLLCGSLTGLSLAHSTGGAEIGIIPPQNPPGECATWGLGGIDACRAEEGLGKLELPTNWKRLSVEDQLLVLVDLERVNRGLAPIAVLIKPLDTLAQTGAARHDDPAFPSCRCFSWVGSIWASADPPSVLEADELWMYDDAGSRWGHRDNILRAGSGLVGGAGAANGNWTFEMISGYRYSPAAVTFRWADELRHFSRRPGLEPLASGERDPDG